MFNNPSKPSLAWVFNDAGSTPGRTTYDPIRYIKRNKSVLVIRTLKSSIFQILDNVVNNFFIEIYNFTIVPPAASIAFCAVAENAWALTSNLAFSSPRPRIFTRSFLETKPCSFKVAKSIAETLCSSANFCKASRLTLAYSTRLGFLKPTFGTRRCNGIWPPSKPILVLLPEREPAPLWPRVDVPPRPEPVPRPILFLFLVEPSAGLRLLKFMILDIFYCYQMINFFHHTYDSRSSFNFNAVVYFT